MVTAYDAQIQRAANTYQLPFDLLAAQAVVESSGQPDAFRYEHGYYLAYLKNNHNAKGFRYGPLGACSYGLLQIVLETAIEQGFTGQPYDLFDPEIGIDWGAKHLRSLWDWAGGTDGDYVQALAAYNGGKSRNTKVPFQQLAYAQRVYRFAGRTP